MITPSFRIPDRAFVWLTAAVITLTWGLVWWAYPYLPDQIPTHFGWSGLPDAYSQKSFWVFALPAILQLLFSGVLWRFYRQPLLGHYPGIPNAALLPQPYRSMLERLGQHLLVAIVTVVSLLMAQISLSIVSIAFGLEERFNTLMVAGLVVVLLGTIALNMLRMSRVARAGESAMKSGST